MGGGGEGGARRGGAGVTWQETVAVLKCIASVNWRILAVTSGEEGAGEVRALEEKALESAIAGLVAQPVDKVYDVAQDAIARFSQQRLSAALDTAFSKKAEEEAVLCHLIAFGPAMAQAASRNGQEVLGRLSRMLLTSTTIGEARDTHAVCVLSAFVRLVRDLHLRDEHAIVCSAPIQKQEVYRQPY